MNGTIGTLARAMNALADAEVHSEAGANGFRYYNDELQYASYSFNAVTPVGSENPSEEGWYVLVDSEYVLTTDTTPQSGKSYYIGGGAVAFKFNGVIYTPTGVDVGINLKYQRTQVVSFTTLTT